MRGATSSQAPQIARTKESQLTVVQVLELPIWRSIQV
jgi:hypothetical protein